jgi:hypothetical protein
MNNNNSLFNNPIDGSNHGLDSELELTYELGNLNHQNTSSIVKETENINYQFIGRAEKVGLPDFDIIGLKAKIDTGAYSASINAHSIRIDGDELVFNVLNDKEFRTKDFATTTVKSSNGESETRYLIKTNLDMGSKRYIIEATLSNRSNMKCPILIGRKFLADNKFVVDVTSRYLLFKQKKNDKLK